VKQVLRETQKSSSDHGELLGDYHCYGKRSFLDVAARVPLLARCPERFAAGARCDAPVSLVDVLPTCLAAAGLPTRPEHAGIDLARIAQEQTERDAIIGQLGQESTGLYMLRSRDFKYVYSAADRTEWLFPTDRWEERSLAGNPAFERALAEHRQRLIEWLRKDGYEMPLDGERWREFPPPPPVPDHPDAWQLFQDLRSVADQFPSGYAPRVTPHSGLPVRGI